MLIDPVRQQNPVLRIRRQQQARKNRPRPVPRRPPRRKHSICQGRRPRRVVVAPVPRRDRIRPVHRQPPVRVIHQKLQPAPRPGKSRTPVLILRIPEHPCDHVINVVRHIHQRPDPRITRPLSLRSLPPRPRPVIRLPRRRPPAHIVVPVDRLVLVLRPTQIVRHHRGIPPLPQVVHPPVRPVQKQMHHPPVRRHMTHLHHRLVREQIAHVKPAVHHVVTPAPQLNTIK